MKVKIHILLVAVARREVKIKNSQKSPCYFSADESLTAPDVPWGNLQKGGYPVKPAKNVYYLINCPENREVLEELENFLVQTFS